MARRALWRYSGFLIAPGSPYRNMQGALTAIRFARESPAVIGNLRRISAPDRGICSQRRWRAGCRACGNEPGAAHLAVTPLHCSLAGQLHPVRLVAGSRAAAIYGATEVLEPFYSRSMDSTPTTARCSNRTASTSAASVRTRRFGLSNYRRTRSSSARCMCHRHGIGRAQLIHCSARSWLQPGWRSLMRACKRPRPSD